MTAPIEVDVAGLGPLRQIGSGGQGKVFGLVDRPDGPVYKEYSPRVVDDLDVDALHRFVQFGQSLAEADREGLLARVAWPEVIVRRDGVVRGFLMRRIPPEFTVAMRFGDEVSQEQALVQYLLNPPAYLTERGLKVTDRFRLEFLRDTADTMALFHKLGIAVGDLSPNNLLFSLTVRPRCFFIDCDAMRLGSDSVLAQAETPDWQVSAVGEEELGTAASDAYKFGLLVVRLFAADQQARDPHAVPARLRGRVVASLSAMPDKRIPPDGWLRTLDKLIAREPEFRPEPLPDRETEQETEQPVAPTPLRAPPLVPPARPTPRWLRWAAAAPAVVVGVLLMIQLFTGSDGSSAGSRAATPPLQQIPRSLLPPGLGGDLTVPRPITPPLITPPRLSNLNLPELLCSLSGQPAQGVRGGEGLRRASTAVGDLMCDVNEGVRGGIVAANPVWAPLRDGAPYAEATITGFFGEGTANPRATVHWVDIADRCVVNSVRFNASYEVVSVGAPSPCG